MLYAIISEDIDDSKEKRRNARLEHLRRIENLVNEGRVIVAGPNPSIDTEDPEETQFTGSLIVAEFPSLEDAEVWATSDPYALAGVYSKITVKPFKKVLP